MNDKTTQNAAKRIAELEAELARVKAENRHIRETHYHESAFKAFASRKAQSNATAFDAITKDKQSLAGFLIAKEKFKPDFFLYENNKSAAQAIKDQIAAELEAPLQYINSALVSAQNRQRFYVHNFGEVPLPEDRGIMLQDVLESETNWTEKAYAYTTRCTGAIPSDTLKRKRHTMVAERVHFEEANYSVINGEKVFVTERAIRQGDRI